MSDGHLPKDYLRSSLKYLSNEIGKIKVSPKIAIKLTQIIFVGGGITPRFQLI